MSHLVMSLVVWIGSWGGDMTENQINCESLRVYRVGPPVMPMNQPV